jgi:two-component system OmpR family response regulator
MTKKAGKKILVAEDDKLLGAVLLRTLGKHGYNVTVVETGDAAIAACDQNEPGILLLDLLMPGSDGFAVLEHLRGRKSAVPVIVMSNLGDDRNRKRCQELGCVAYVVKSDIDEDGILPLIERHIR